MDFIIILITWLLTGILSFLGVCIAEMRGKEYNENYFNGVFGACMLLIAFGYASPILAVLTCADWEKLKERFTRFIYNIANIGMKNKADEL